MPSRFNLIINADYPNRTADFRLLDGHGTQLGYRQAVFKNIPVSRQQGLFDLRNYLRLYVEGDKESGVVAEIGVCIAEDVLGKEIFEQLWKSQSQRTLCIQLPGASDDENHLAAALARVPWEIARPSVNQQTLGERNLLVRIVHDMQAPASQPLELPANESLRILFVFAEARGSRPLGARKERRELLELLNNEIYPNRRVVAHFLTHGVTRERLEAQVQENGGYHIVHWSGHGHMNLLELAKPGGAKDLLSGEMLLDLFHKAGGFLPRLFFLSACHSGDILRVQDWNDFLAVAQGKEPGTKTTEAKALDLKEQPGYTGTAHALLQGGVPSVVAMRYAVGDEYARELSVEFYRALLAHSQPKSVAAALTMARQSLQDGKKHDLARFDICDHATPVLYGEELSGFTLAKGRSPSLNPRNPRLHQIAELTTAGHEHFVGRTWELAGMGADFVGSSTGAEVKHVAIITGLGGMGKTALTAEALSLWESRFEWVLLYQAKTIPFGFDATLRDIHIKLIGELGRYHDHVKLHPADAIYRDPSTEFTGPGRHERLTRNLIRAMQDEPILLVLDNFETNLKPQAEPSTAQGLTGWACQDPAWDRCLAAMAKELVGSPSRVLITCRLPLAALDGGNSHRVQLGPLAASEAALFLKEHSGLSRMVFGADPNEKQLAVRLLNASRFHPLLMDRLARLAVDSALRTQLLQTLDTLEKKKDFAQLPVLFAANPGSTKELGYLDDALAISIDYLIRDTSPDARRLLWIIAVANEPVEMGLLNGVWSGESHLQQQLRCIKVMLDVLPLLPEDLRSHAESQLPPLPSELYSMLDALPPERHDKPDLSPLLYQLITVGLVSEEFAEPKDDSPHITCHELVRERVGAWMEQHPHDQGDLNTNAIRLAYAEWLETEFLEQQHKDLTVALKAGSRAIIYCVQAGAHDSLVGFASRVVTSVQGPHLLEGLIPYLQAAAESAPEGPLRRNCLCNVADALRQGGRPELSLCVYEQAALQSRTAVKSVGEDFQQAYVDLGVITNNWAIALRDLGCLEEARERLLEATDACKKSGAAIIYAIGSELETLRIDIWQGSVDAALPEVEARLSQIEAWWKRHRAGELVPEAADAEFLTRVFISALDLAREANFARAEWESAMRRIDVIIDVKLSLDRSLDDIGIDRLNRAIVLEQQWRLAESKTEVEACIQIFQNNPGMRAKALGTLASLFDKQNDVTQAIIQERRALAISELLFDPAQQANSHGNLGNYLERSDTRSAVAESRHHQLAALIYSMVSGVMVSFKIWEQNYAFRMHLAHAAGIELHVPRVSDLLADPAFHPLDQWLLQRGVDLVELQSKIDQLLEQVRKAAIQSPTE